jgi:adenylate cyclase
MVLGVALALPVVGVAVLLAAPSTDVRWEHQPSHFWLVLASAMLPALLGWAIGTAACRRADARLFLVSLAFVAAASFLGLHALATPRVLLDAPNAGFVIAVPVGLLLSSMFAAWSATELSGGRARRILDRSRLLRGTLLAVIVVWGAWSLAALPPLEDPSPPESGSTALLVLTVPGVALFAVAAVRYVDLARRRASPLLRAVAAAWVLLAEALLAAAVARNWRASWWAWHVLMLIAFGAIAWAARRLPESERFSDLYLDEVAGGTREISVLFADLQGFTTYSESHDPTEVQAMVNAYFDAVVPAVRAEDGRVDSFLGDAVMVTFNVTDDQPDHALRAARAALGLQRAAEPVSDAHPEWPRFRVGVNTGVAAVGVIGGADARGYTVLGDTVNVASRIEALAPVGGVAIGEATLRALRGAVVTHIGTVSLKGRSEAVDVFRLDALPPG